MNAVYETLVPVRCCSLLRHVSVPLNHHQAMLIQFYENCYTHNGSVVVIGSILSLLCVIDLML
jgi:hypothetical protein